MKNIVIPHYIANLAINCGLPLKVVYAEYSKAILQGESPEKTKHNIVAAIALTDNLTKSPLYNQLLELKARKAQERR